MHRRPKKARARPSSMTERREWFLVPLPVIDEAVQRIRDGSINNVIYERKTARLVIAK
jgi:hypothetical protein